MFGYFARFFYLLITLAMVGCCLTCTEISPNMPPGDDFVYPLKIGNSWNYIGEFAVYNVTPDSMTEKVGLDFTETSQIEVIADTALMDSIDVFVLREVLVQHEVDPDSFVTDNYFRNLENGLYYYGSNGISSKGVPLKANPHKYYFMKDDEVYDNPRALFGMPLMSAPGLCLKAYPVSLTFPPRHSLRYPLEPGVLWRTFEATDVVAIDKIVVGYEMVETPAGKFPCCVVKWLLDLDVDGVVETDYEYYDYISHAGLIKRVIIVRNVIIGSYEHPTGIATADIRNDFVLTVYDQ